MKANKLMLAAMLVAGLTMAFNTSCKKKDKDPVVVPVDTTKVDPEPEPEPQAEIPEVADPEEGFVTMVINVPAGSECNGIAFKGTMDGSNWTQADQYLSNDGPAAPDACIKFEKINDTWFKATFKLGEAAWGDGIYLAGKICLIYSGDGSWEGQAVDWEFNEDYSTIDHSISSDGNVQVNGTQGKLYITIDHFQFSECKEKVYHDYKISIKVPAWCADEVELELIGDFNSWSDEGTIALVKEGDAYVATVNAWEESGLKARQVGTWANEVTLVGQTFTDDEGKIHAQGVDNISLGEEVEVVVDYTDPEVYAWTVCRTDI